MESKYPFNIIISIFTITGLLSNMNSIIQQKSSASVHSVCLEKDQTTKQAETVCEMHSEDIPVIFISVLLYIKI